MQHLECGATKFHVYKMANAGHGFREHNKKSARNKVFSIASLVIVVPILKEVRNLFESFHFIDLDSSIWFRYQMINMRNLKPFDDLY